MASSNQQPGRPPTVVSKPQLSTCYECYAEVEDMKLHKKRCHPEKYWCDECKEFVKTDTECRHNVRYHARVLGLTELEHRHPVQKINFTEELKKMKGTRNDWVIVPKSKFEVLWDSVHNSALLALEDLTAEDLEVKYNDPNHEWYQETGIPGVRCVDKGSYRELEPPMDTGHLAARANYRLSEQDTIDTFSLLNGIPQRSAVNNGKVKRLENHYRRLVSKWDDVIQATGPIYDHKKTDPQKSQNGLEVYVPTGFFKLMKMRRKGEEPKVQAFRLDHSNVEFQSVLSMRSTVAEIADLTQLNLDLFANFEYNWDAEEESFFCKKCLKSYRTQEELDNCSKSHEHYCAQCHRSFNSKAERDEHLVSNHSISCENCGRVFTNLTLLKRHMEVHDNERKYACSQCQSRFNNKHLLDDHIKSVHEIEKVLCPIEDCGQMINKVRLTAHLTKVHTEEQYVCTTAEWCNKATKTKWEMIRHNNLLHTFLPKVKCPEAGCARLFANMRTFLSHRKKDHKRKDKFPKSLYSSVEIDPEVAKKLKPAGNQKPGYLTMQEWMTKYAQTSSPTTASATIPSGALEDQVSHMSQSANDDLFTFTDDFEETAQTSTPGTSGLTESQSAGVSSIVKTFIKSSLVSQNSTPPRSSSSSFKNSKPASDTLINLTDDDAPPADKINRTSGAKIVDGWVMLPPNTITKRKSGNASSSTKPNNKRMKKK